MSDSAKSLLAEHVACREAWLAATESVLVTDHRVEAVILYGSFGRDDVDEWSDVDMIVIISDANLPSVVADRLAFGTRFGAPLYILDSTWNAPLDGAQVNVLYLLDSGLPLYVDFNIWPLSMAARPEGTKLLYERSRGLVPAVASSFESWATYERQPRPSPKEVDELTLRHARFGMVPIALKFCVRGQRERLVRLLNNIGAASVPEGPQGEMAVIRERLDALSQGQPQATVNAVQAMSETAEAAIGLG